MLHLVPQVYVIVDIFFMTQLWRVWTIAHAGELLFLQVLGDKAFQNFGKGFISMHFSDQHSTAHKKMLLFKFALPDVKHMADMTRLVALIPYYIDLVGRYKLSSQVSSKQWLIFTNEWFRLILKQKFDTVHVQARSKTEAARSKALQEAYKELHNARQEAMQKKKAEKKRMLEEAEAKLSAESVRKKEAKERARQMKKSMPKMKMTRAH